MKITWKIYLVLGLIFVASVLVSLYLPTTEILHDISSIPAVVALIGGIFQIFKDQAAFEKKLIIQQNQNKFTLGAASHMANIAFDKHVAFCEEYITEMHKIVSELFTEGPSPKALKHAYNLYEIQQKYTTWLTPAITESINKFEQALREIGADSDFIRNTIGTDDPERGPAIKRMYKVFKDVLEIRKSEDIEINKDVAVNSIINRLRAVLGIEELTILRQNLIASSVKTLKK